MLAQSEKKILWHPRGENKFIVGGGSQITMYEWSPEEPAIRHITSQQDIAHMKVRGFIFPAGCSFWSKGCGRPIGIPMSDDGYESVKRCRECDPGRCTGAKGECSPYVDGLQCSGTKRVTAGYTC